MTHSGKKDHFPGPVSVNNTVLTVETQCITILTLLWDAVDKLQETKYILKMIFIGNLVTMRMIWQWQWQWGWYDNDLVLLWAESPRHCVETPGPALWCTGGYVWGQGLNMKWEIMWIVDVIIFIKIGLSLGLRKGAIISMRSHNNNDNSSYVQCMTSFPQCVLINCPGRIYWHCHTCHGGI